jgi:uncharacterized protein (TIGR02145 family)
LQNTIGSYNTSLGYNSGTNNTSGTYITIVGANANVASASLTNATAIGSGATVSASNTIQLGSNSVTSVRTNGALTTGSVTFPTTHGTTGQVLTTTGSGTLTWTSPSSSSTSSVAVFLPTIVIGTQQWTKENLDVMTYRNGDVIPYVADQSTWNGLTTGAWCYYNNDPTNGPIYGKLYNWYAVNDVRGLAPTGWHIPTDAEWTTLTTKLGTRSADDSGFKGLLAGRRRSDGFINDVSYGLAHSSNPYGNWWSSEQNNDYPPNYPSAYNRYQGPGGGFARSWSNKPEGLSVRCIRD